ncbi:MAG: hypothetical protein V8T90_09850 [Victivallales bacterium]|jgi:hypothetical protein
MSRHSDNPECFGKITNTGRCPHCPYMEACRFASDDRKRVEAQNARWANAYEYDDGLNSAPELPVDVTPGRSFSHDEVVALSAFLLRIGSNKKLGRILEAKLMGAKSFTQIARQEGVTRQAIHKRIGKELATIFGFKSRQLTDSRLLSLSPQEFTLLKLSREGFCDEEIRQEMRFNAATLKEVRSRLEWKLSHPT